MTSDDDENPSHRSGASALYPGMFELRDQDALALLRKRDEHGFDLAYERYAERIFGFLVRLSRSRAVAEDLVQHTFMRLAEHGPRLRPESDLRAWLFTVARNAYQSHARGLGLEARLDPALAWPPPSPATGAEFGLALRELERALCRLQSEDRELLLLVGVEGLSYAEVAVVLAIDAVTARKRVSRARTRLAEILDGQVSVVRSSEVKP